LLDVETRAAESDATKRALAQEAWRTTMDAWQRAEMFQFGPAAMTGTGSPGARDMRDPVYSWPVVSRCLIDQVIVAKTYEVGDFGTLSLVSTRTLAALEYLLFYDGADNGCPATDAINAQGTWAALGSEEIAKRKATYARVVASDVVTRMQKLTD